MDKDMNKTNKLNKEEERHDLEDRIRDLIHKDTPQKKVIFSYSGPEVDGPEVTIYTKDPDHGYYMTLYHGAGSELMLRHGGQNEIYAQVDVLKKALEWLSTKKETSNIFNVHWRFPEDKKGTRISQFYAKNVHEVVKRFFAHIPEERVSVEKVELVPRS